MRDHIATTHELTALSTPTIDPQAETRERGQQVKPSHVDRTRRKSTSPTPIHSQHTHTLHTHPPSPPSPPQLPEIQTVDLDVYTNGDAAARAAEGAKAAASLHATGCLYVKDSRVAAADNERFLDLLERYFAASDGRRDARPELHYQVGVTPAMVERPRDHCARVAGLDGGNKPLTLCPPEADPKWRYFWRVVRT